MLSELQKGPIKYFLFWSFRLRAKQCDVLLCLFHYNPFFLFSDAFDVNNGLQCKGKNNVLGIYMSVLNLMQHNRTSRNGCLTIQLIKNWQIKQFGFNNCMKRLVDEINDLVKNGFILPNGLKARNIKRGVSNSL